MAHRTPGPGNFALHTPNAQPNEGASRDSLRDTAHTPEQELGRIRYFTCGGCAVSRFLGALNRENPPLVQSAHE